MLAKHTPDVVLRQVLCYRTWTHLRTTCGCSTFCAPSAISKVSHEIIIKPTVAYCLANCALKVLVGDMINDTMDDFGVLDYSTTSAGTVLDTLALLSTRGGAVGTALQVFRTAGIRHAPRERVCHEPIAVTTTK